LSEEQAEATERPRPAGAPAPFAVLPSGRITWAVAAIHGEADRLVALHDQLAPRIGPQDNLVYLGNMLGRGRHVAATVHELLLFRRAVLARQLADGCGTIAYLRGCQEEMWHKLLQMQFAPDPRAVFDWMVGQGVAATIEAYGGTVAEGRTAANRGALALSQWTNRLRAAIRAQDGHDRLIHTVRRAAYTDDGELLFVAAGVDPDRPLDRQADAFWWGNAGFDRDDRPASGFRRTVRGHAPRRPGVVVGAYVTSIDGGCGFAGPLVAGAFDAAGQLVEIIEA
jgi:serine/threonine protein phosphatase 1